MHQKAQPNNLMQHQHQKQMKLCTSNYRTNWNIGMSSSKSVLVLGVVLVVMITNVNTSEMCEPALKILVKHGVATPDMITQLPSNGSEVCRGGPCCMPSMSDTMLSRGRHLLHSSVHRETTNLLEAVTVARDAFRGAVEAALHRSEERTLESFRLSYPRLVGHVKEPLRELFASLHSSLISTEENSVDRALETFWDDLFPLVYHSTVHSRLPPFTHGYMECLRKSRKSIKPWKVVPTLIGQSLIRGLDTARLMVNTLNVASDVVLNAMHYEIPDECGNAAARFYFCGSCQAVSASPCSGFCLNVARGCLAPLAELNGMWNTMGTASLRVDEAIRVSGLSLVLKELPEKFSDAIMVAMESGNKLQKLVRNKCGPYNHEPSVEWEAKTQEGLLEKTESSLVKTENDKEGDALNLKSNEAASTLSNSHNYWRKLADKTCSHLASQVTDCWNGDKIASYNRQVARIGVSAQKYNPEVQVQRPDASVYSLADQMRNVKRTITKVLAWMPESYSKKVDDPSAVEGSGYEDGNSYPNTDDEDGEDDGFGSGSYPSTNKNVNPLDTPAVPPTTAQGSSLAYPTSVVFGLTIWMAYLHKFSSWLL